MPLVDSTCFLGLLPAQRWEQIYLALGGTDECFAGLTVFEQQRAILGVLGSEECIYSTEGFWRAWAAILGIECVESTLDAQNQIYAYYYDQAGDDTLPAPYCFEGLGPDGQLLALYEALGGGGGGNTPLFWSTEPVEFSESGITFADLTY